MHLGRRITWEKNLPEIMLIPQQQNAKGALHNIDFG